MTKLSLKQAAEWAGTTKPTILKHIKASKVSAGKDDEGRWWFDPAELVRAYGEPKSGNAAGNAAGTGSEPGELYERTSLGNTLETEAQQALVTELRARIAELKSDKDELRRQVDEERAERDRLLNVIERQAEHVKLLTDQRPKEPINPPAAPEPSKGFFRRLLGG